MTTGEGKMTELPNAAEVLAEAYDIGHRPDASVLALERAALLLNIARELREGARRPRAVVVGDNVPDEVVGVLDDAYRDRDEWRRDAEMAHKEIAGLLRQGSEWRSLAESRAAELRELRRTTDAWRQRAELFEQRLAGLPSSDRYKALAELREPMRLATGGTVKQDGSLFAAGEDFGKTYGGEPAYGGKLADPGLWNTAVMGLPDDLRSALGGAVYEETQQVERFKLDDTKVAVPAPRPADLRFPSVNEGRIDGECEHCAGEVYLAKQPGKVDGDEVMLEAWRHRDTGVQACPDGAHCAVPK